MPRNNSKERREQRRVEAAERLAKNADGVLDCSCGNRHHIEWAGCREGALAAFREQAGAKR